MDEGFGSSDGISKLTRKQSKMIPLNEIQRAVLEAIIDNVRAWGEVPSFDQMQEITGLKRCQIQEALYGLEKRKYILRNPRRRQNIQLLEDVI